jgi:hypothetical protein
MSRLMRILAKLLAMLNPRRNRKRKRVTMRYLMLLCLTVSAMPCIEFIAIR